MKFFLIILTFFIFLHACVAMDTLHFDFLKKKTPSMRRIKRIKSKSLRFYLFKNINEKKITNFALKIPKFKMSINSSKKPKLSEKFNTFSNC